jgi:hypothetical protein
VVRRSCSLRHPRPEATREHGGGGGGVFRRSGQLGSGSPSRDPHECATSVACGTTVLAVGALLALTPLKQVVPFVVRVDNTTGVLDVVSALNAAWAVKWAMGNPQSPLNRYKDGTDLSVSVRDVSFIERAHGVHDLAQGALFHQPACRRRRDGRYRELDRDDPVRVRRAVVGPPCAGGIRSAFGSSPSTPNTRCLRPLPAACLRQAVPLEGAMTRRTVPHALAAAQRSLAGGISSGGVP